MLLSVTRHVLRVGGMLALCALAAVACGAPDGEAKPRPLPDGPRKLEPGAYRTEQFEPAFYFEVGGGWTNVPPEAYDEVLITRGHGEVGLGFANLGGASFFEPTKTGAPRVVGTPEDPVGWFRRHPYLEVAASGPAEVGGVEGVRLDLTVGGLPDGYSGACGRGCVDAFRPSSGGGPVAFREGDTFRQIVLEDVEGETVLVGFAGPSDEFDGYASEAQKVIDTVRWGGG